MRLTPHVMLVVGRAQQVAWMATGMVMRMATTVKSDDAGGTRLFELPATYVRQTVLITGLN